MTEPAGRLSVPPEKVVDILTRSELGAAMWKAAYFEALTQVQSERLAQLEARQNGAPADRGWEVPPDGEAS